jgi:hypothetical protein
MANTHCPTLIKFSTLLRVSTFFTRTLIIFSSFFNIFLIFNDFFKILNFYWFIDFGANKLVIPTGLSIILTNLPVETSFCYPKV